MISPATGMTMATILTAAPVLVAKKVEKASITGGSVKTNEFLFSCGLSLGQCSVYFPATLYSYDMEEHLLEEWRKFSLTEDEAPGFVVDDDAMALKSSMLRLWGVTRGITIKQIGENLFVFQFPNEHERSRLLKYERLPWLCFHCGVIGHLERDCVIRCRGGQKVGEAVQQYGPWLRAAELNQRRRDQGPSFSVPAQNEESTIPAGPQKSQQMDMHVDRVEAEVSQHSMDISKPIPRGRLITFLSLGQMWVSFKYERLPWLCFHCGVIGHLERDCVIRCRGGQKVGEAVQQYGPWLRAAELNQRRRDQGPSFSVPAQNEESTIPAGPQKSQQMDMHVDRVEAEVSQHDVNDKAHAQHETVIAKEKESSKVVLPKDKGVAFSGLSHIPENRQNYEKVAGVLNAPSVTTNISTKSLPHVAQFIVNQPCYYPIYSLLHINPVPSVTPRW
uniref:CCHC-type domain-containing protein n=1 Tax=Fagus sylvatica TaxID=28930 RepID=A0A2N9I2N9_FAGSY